MGYPKADFPELAEADARIKEPRTQEDVDELLEAIHAHPYFVEVQQRLRDFGARPAELQPADALRRPGRLHAGSRRVAREDCRHVLPGGSGRRSRRDATGLVVHGLCRRGQDVNPGQSRAGVHAQPLAHLDADDIQMRLPGYEGWNADLFHREAHDVLWQELVPRAIAGRYRLVLDSTGHKMAEMKHVTDLLLVHGYQVRLLDIKLPAYVAAYRCWVRFRAGGLAHDPADPDLGRFVPPEAVLCCEDPGSTYRELRDNPHVAAWLQVDSSGPPSGDFHVIEQGEHRIRRFRDHATEGVPPLASARGFVPLQTPC